MVLPSSSEILAASVNCLRSLENPNPVPHEAQSRFVEAMDGAAQRKGGAAGVMHTGTGKSLTALAFAAAHALQGEKTVISTASKSLQDQYVGKDNSTLQAALREQGRRSVEVRSLKGFGSYPCLLNVSISAGKELGLDQDKFTGEEASELFSAVEEELKAEIEDDARRQRLVALLSLLDRDKATTRYGQVADRSHYPDMRDEEWESYSTSKAECVGSECPFRAKCAPVKARNLAAEAEVLVVNHHILAVQAAFGAPLFWQSPVPEGKIGVQHFIIDEAHQLPETIRSTSHTKIADSNITRLLGRVEEALGGSLVGDSKEDFAIASSALQNAVKETYEKCKERHMDEWSPQYGDALLTVLDRIQTWVFDALKNDLEDEDVSTQRRAKRAIQGSRKLYSKARSFVEPAAHRARWVTREFGPNGYWYEANSQDVDTAERVRLRLWQPPFDERQTDENADELESSIASIEGKLPPEREPVTRILMSGTLPKQSVADLGIDVTPTKFKRPFESAFSQSVILIPTVSRIDYEDIEALRQDNNLSSMDTKKHARWAIPHVVRLCNANEGRALVLSATGEGVKAYAEAIRSAGFTVFEQDGKDATVEEWKDNPRSVLVGSRMYMTGLDAKGDTCSLVILDRVPRNRPNAADDARAVGNGYRDSNEVYVSDARMLLEQAVGRLVRSKSDVGMVAVLDPRLAPGRGYFYSQARDYEGAYAHFPRRINSFEGAEYWLSVQCQRRSSASADFVESIFGPPLAPTR